MGIATKDRQKALGTVFSYRLPPIAYSLIRLLLISLGSLAELEYLLKFAVDIGYMDEKELVEVKTLMDEAGKLLWGLRKSKQPQICSVSFPTAYCL